MRTFVARLVCVVIACAPLAVPALAQAQRDAVIVVYTDFDAPHPERAFVWVRPDGVPAHVSCTRNRCLLTEWFGGAGVYRIGSTSSLVAPEGAPVLFSGHETTAWALLSRSVGRLDLGSSAEDVALVDATGQARTMVGGATEESRLEVQNRGHEPIRVPLVRDQVACGVELAGADGAWEPPRPRLCATELDLLDLPRDGEIAPGHSPRCSSHHLLPDAAHRRRRIVVHIDASSELTEGLVVYRRRQATFLLDP